jgi:alcohol dehydrogenase/L-iditol 2-dehydrogenase
VIGLKVDESRLKVARKLGADVIIKGDEENPVGRVMELTEGLGANLVIDSAGSSITLKQSLEMVRRMGQITKIGWGPSPVGFSLDLLISKAVTLQGTYGHNWRSWINVLKLMAAGKLNSKALISHVFPITEWERAYRLAEGREAVKVILKPRG